MSAKASSKSDEIDREYLENSTVFAVGHRIDGLLTIGPGRYDTMVDAAKTAGMLVAKYGLSFEVVRVAY